MVYVIIVSMDGILQQCRNCTIFLNDLQLHVAKAMKVVMCMKVGFIGAGKVGFSLGRYFSEHGIEVSGYYSRNIQSAREAAIFTGTIAYEGIESVLGASDILFFTVNDDAIFDCYNQLKCELIQGKIFCHASGVMSAEEVFVDIELRGAWGYSVHPLFAISDKFCAYEELADVFFTLEGSEEKLDFMLQWLSNAGLHVKAIGAEAKAKYHAAAAIVSNHVVGIFAEAQQLFMECGFSEQESKWALEKIFLGNAHNIAAKGVTAALTGPVQRGDICTLKKHLGVLEQLDDKLLYVLLSQRLVKIAKLKNSAYDDTAICKFLKENYCKILDKIGKNCEGDMNT